MTLDDLDFLPQGTPGLNIHVVLDYHKRILRIAMIWRIFVYKQDCR